MHNVSNTKQQNCVTKQCEKKNLLEILHYSFSLNYTEINVLHQHSLTENVHKMSKL